MKKTRNLIRLASSFSKKYAEFGWPFGEKIVSPDIVNTIRDAVGAKSGRGLGNDEYPIDNFIPTLKGRSVTFIVKPNTLGGYTVTCDAGFAKICLQIKKYLDRFLKELAPSYDGGDIKLVYPAP
jgi:hypothetical protein